MLTKLLHEFLFWVIFLVVSGWLYWTWKYKSRFEKNLNPKDYPNKSDKTIYDYGNYLIVFLVSIVAVFGIFSIPTSSVEKVGVLEGTVVDTNVTNSAMTPNSKIDITPKKSIVLPTNATLQMGESNGLGNPVKVHYEVRRTAPYGFVGALSGFKPVYSLVVTNSRVDKQQLNDYKKQESIGKRELANMKRDSSKKKESSRAYSAKLASQQANTYTTSTAYMDSYSYYINSYTGEQHVVKTKVPYNTQVTVADKIKSDNAKKKSKSDKSKKSSTKSSHKHLTKTEKKRVEQKKKEAERREEEKSYWKTVLNVPKQ